MVWNLSCCFFESFRLWFLCFLLCLSLSLSLAHTHTLIARAEDFELSIRRLHFCIGRAIYSNVMGYFGGINWYFHLTSSAFCNLLHMIVHRSHFVRIPSHSCPFSSSSFSPLHYCFSCLLQGHSSGTRLSTVPQCQSCLHSQGILHVR